MRETGVEEIRARLHREFGYSTQEAEMLAQDLTGLKGPVRAAFVHWWHTGEVRPLDIHGYSIERLQKQHRMDTIAAFLTLGWLFEDPQSALESIAQGYDWIDVGPGSGK